MTTTAAATTNTTIPLKRKVLNPSTKLYEWKAHNVSYDPKTKVLFGFDSNKKFRIKCLKVEAKKGSTRFEIICGDNDEQQQREEFMASSKLEMMQWVTYLRKTSFNSSSSVSDSKRSSSSTEQCFALSSNNQGSTSTTRLAMRRMSSVSNIESSSLEEAPNALDLLEENNAPVQLHKDTTRKKKVLSKRRQKQNIPPKKQKRKPVTLPAPPAPAARTIKKKKKSSTVKRRKSKSVEEPLKESDDHPSEDLPEDLPEIPSTPVPSTLPTLPHKTEDNDDENALKKAQNRIKQLQAEVVQNQEAVEKLKAMSVQDSQEQYTILSRLENILLVSEKDKERSSDLVANLRRELDEKTEYLGQLEVQNRELRCRAEAAENDRATMKQSMVQYREELDRLRQQVTVAKQEVFMSTRETTRLQQEKRCLTQDIRRLDTIVYYNNDNY